MMGNSVTEPVDSPASEKISRQAAKERAR